MTFIGKDQVAQILDLPDGDSFLRHRQRLENECDFPLPMPTCRRPLRWRRTEIEFWLERQGLSASDQKDLAPPPVVAALMKQAATA